MATRLYFSSLGVTVRSPTFDASWERTTGAIRRNLHTVKENTSNNNLTLTKGIATDPADVLMYQFVSRPLSAQTITGTVKSVIQAIASDANNARAQLLIKVVSYDFATTRGTLLAHDGSALSNAFNTSIRNAKFPLNWTGSGTSLTSVTAQDTDLILIEIGARMSGAPTTPTFTLRMGDPTSLSDLAENETDTADGVPWIEFSQTLNFMESTSSASGSRADTTAPIWTATASTYSTNLPPQINNSATYTPTSSIYSTNILSGAGMTPQTQLGAATLGPKPKKYKMRAATISGYVTWINITGDDTGRPISAIGPSQIIDVWD